MTTQSQKTKRTQITTVLDQNKDSENAPLLLAMVQCSEAISAPYYMDVVMLADRKLEINPDTMINTPATVSVRVEDIDARHPRDTFNFTYQTRKGVFQNFIRQDRFHRRIGKDYNVYAGRIVPAFVLMDQEVRNRIFEKPNLDFLTVLHSCMSSFQGLNLANYVDDSAVVEAIKDEKSPKMEHCVQYGESTFNFLSRLMSRFSIWYYFDHDGDSAHEKMVLGSGGPFSSKNHFKSCTLAENFADPRDLEKQGIIENWQIITGLSRTYTPAPRLERTSDFNTVISTRPIQSNDDSPKTRVGSNFDIINRSDGRDGPSPDTTFIQEAFPDSTIFDDDDATGDAEATMNIAEGQVFTVSATSKNATFCAGRIYLYGRGDDNPTSTHHLITRMAFNAYERDYYFIISRDDGYGLAALLDDLLVQPGASFVAQFGSGKAPDLATAMAAAGLQEAINNTSENAWSTAHATQAQNDFAQKNLPPTPDFGAYFTAGMLGYFSSFLPNTTTILQDLRIPIEIAISLMLGALQGIVDTIVFIPALFARLAGKDLLGDLNRHFDELRKKIIIFFDHLLRPAETNAFSTTYIAIPLDKTGFGVPLPTARNAQIFGPHLATVIGPDGIDISKNEIWADQLGRVRVRFPWDRVPLGVSPKSDPLFPPPNAEWTDAGAKDQYLVGVNTAWLRVSDAWAGLRFGSQFLPRIGDEVVVSFIDSDPDRPLITGRVYNASNTQPTLPFPNQEGTTIQNMKDLQKLSGNNNFTRSGFRTRIFKQKRSDFSKFHLLRWDDLADKPQYLIRSQGRLDMTVFNHRYENVHRNRNMIVGGKQETPTRGIGGDYITKIYRHYYLHVGDPGFSRDNPPESGNRVTRIEQDDGLFVGKNYQLDAGTYSALTGNYYLHVSGRPGSGGGKRDTIIDNNDNLHVKVDLNQTIDGNWSNFCTKQISMMANGAIALSSVTNISLICGSSAVVITPTGIQIFGPVIEKQSGGNATDPLNPPAVTEHDPSVPKPAEPTSADPGDSLDPPKWQE